MCDETKTKTKSHANSTFTLFSHFNATIRQSCNTELYEKRSTRTAQLATVANDKNYVFKKD